MIPLTKILRTFLVERPSVCLSVCLSHHSAAACSCGGFSAVGPAAWRYRSIAARPALSMQQMRAASRCQLRRLRLVRSSLTEQSARTLVRAFVSTTATACMLYSVSDELLQKLQVAQNAAARYTGGDGSHDVRPDHYASCSPSVNMSTWRLLYTRPTQPCIPPGSLNRVPASAGVRAGMSPLPGGR